MRVVAYNIKEFEKELLAKANAKVHDLTFISNPLTLCTIRYAAGKDAVIISEQDLVDQSILSQLNHLGIKNIVTRSSSITHIDMKAAQSLHMHVSNIDDSATSGMSMAEQTILKLRNDELFTIDTTASLPIHPLKK